MGSALDVVVGLAPVAVLVALTVIGVRTDKSLPIATVLLWLITLVYFKFEPNEMNATVVRGVGEALTPIAIVFGAVSLFEAMKLTPVLDWMRSTLKRFSQGNKAGELFLIAWSFSYLIEGCSGFGTPTALSAPLLCELGYEPLEAVVTCLIMNTLATPFGAAGTPIWFGLDIRGFDDDDFVTIGFWAQLVCFSAAHFVPLAAVASTFAALPRKELPRHLLVSLACIYSCSLTSLVISYFSAELPTLLGGFIGLIISGLIVKATSSSTTESKCKADEEDNDASSQRIELAQRDSDFMETSSRREPTLVALSMDEITSSRRGVRPAQDSDEAANDAADDAPNQPLWKFIFPISMVVFFLTLTRAPYLDIKDELRSKHPRATVRLGSFGEFYVSTAVVVGLEDIFRESVSTSFDVLYNPAILPFFVVAILTLLIFGEKDKIPDLLNVTWKRTSAVIIPITAALIFSQLFRAGVSEEIARPLVTSLGKFGWTIIAPCFGILGSFFSGSTTVSNLTFGSIHILASNRLGLNKFKLLALQTVGATIGNCVCLQNIISAKTVVGLDILEAYIIARTAKCALLFTVFAWIWGIIYLYI